MKVSIIIPVFNAEKFLEECLISAINQTYPDIEIIAVNDGSTDNSLEILNKYSNNIKIFSKENGGVASALNAGIKLATGEWIKILAADDILYPTATEELMSAANKIENKKQTILYANYEHIDSEGKIIHVVDEPDYNSLSNFDFNVRLLDHYLANEDTVLIHKSTINEFGLYNEKIPFFEGYELRLRYCLLHGCRFHLIKKIISKYRIHFDQIRKQRIQAYLKEMAIIRKSILSKLPDAEQQKYEQALEQYRKNKPLEEKLKLFFRFNLLPHLPNSFSKKIVTSYWSIKNK